MWTQQWHTLNEAQIAEIPWYNIKKFNNFENWDAGMDLS